MTASTILIQGDNRYSAVEVDGVVYWFRKCHVCGGDGFTPEHDRFDPHEGGVCTQCPIAVPCESCETSGQIKIAQSSNVLEGVPVISESIDTLALFCSCYPKLYVKGTQRRLYLAFFGHGVQAAQSDKKYSEDDLREAIRQAFDVAEYGIFNSARDGATEAILKSLNQISEITVDENFKTIKVV